MKKRRTKRRLDKQYSFLLPPQAEKTFDFSGRDYTLNIHDKEEVFEWLRDIGLEDFIAGWEEESIAKNPFRNGTLLAFVVKKVTGVEVFDVDFDPKCVFDC